MKITIWGTRGSVARAGEGTIRYGGDTACVEVRASDGTLLILDGGSGLLHVTPRIAPDAARIDVFLTHLHMDHIQGLGFFYPLRFQQPETHIWGPASTMGLGDRLARYLSPPLFPVRLREFIATHLHDLGGETVELGPFRITADYICHPGPTLGYRIEEDGRALVYMPDHEPALGHRRFPGDPRWTSGADLARAADLLLHDAQYTHDEYATRVGWGHSSLPDAVRFAGQMGVGKLVTFHHDPEHTDDLLDELHHQAVEVLQSEVEVIPGKAGWVYEF